MNDRANEAERRQLERFSYGVDVIEVHGESGLTLVGDGVVGKRHG
jgi:hypothetical protein